MSSRSARSQMEMPRSRDARPGLRIHEGAAAGRQHMHGIVEQPQDHPPLALAEALLAMALEDLGDGAAGRRLDLLVGIDEAKLQPLRQALADAGLAHAHQPDEDDGLRQFAGLQCRP